LSRETKEVYKKINSSASSLLSIINNISDLSKIEANKIELLNEEFELEKLIGDTLLMTSPRLEGKHVEFMLSTSFDLPRFVVGDKVKLAQILKNFFDNSARYTEYGKIVLTVLLNNQKSDTQNVWLSFVIEDTGSGMSKEQTQKLFAPYDKTENEYVSSGLGMAVSRQLCELMGGELKTASRPGEGTIIHLSIPFKHSKNTETLLHFAKFVPLKGTEILVADDDERSLSIIASLLTEAKADFELARSGEEAIKIIHERRSTGKSFDLVLLDYMMGGMNGLQAAGKIQAAVPKQQKVLMVTAYQKIGLEQALIKGGGIDNMLEKPFIPSDFINKICLTLGRGDGSGKKS
jgi:two-component system sensor histidine kinase/response regulator